MAFVSKKHSHSLVIALAAGALVSGLVVSHFWPPAEAQSTVCQTGYSLEVPGAIPGGAVTIGLASSNATTIRDVVFKIDGLVLGRGVGTAPHWQMQWYTQYSAPGVRSISAQLFTTDGNSCQIPPVQTTLTNTLTPGAILDATALPVTFQGLTNQPINFNLNAYISSTAASSVDVTQFTYFANKATTLGSITPLDGTSILRLSTGPVAGTGQTTVTASYGGITRDITIPIVVIAQASPAPTDPTAATTVNNPDSSTTNTQPTTSSTNTSTTPATEAQIAAASTASVEAEKPLKDCVLLKLGDERYKAISSGESRPTATEFASINQCFSTRNFVLPSGFVPVPPSQVKDKPESKDISVKSPVNESSGSTTKLKFQGKAKPNTLVLLYVYSEPLVLSTTSDSNGDWSYALEDPLQPGNHEIYAVVDKGDGTYQRSSVFDFAIAKAEASPSNPKSYSLKLSTIQPTAKDTAKSSLLYIVGIIVLVAAMLGVVAFVFMKKQKKAAVTPVVTSALAPEPIIEAPVPALKSDVPQTVPAAQDVAVQVAKEQLAQAAPATAQPVAQVLQPPAQPNSQEQTHES